MDWAGGAVEGKLCSVSACQTRHVATRNGRSLCAKHRDHYDHSTFGEPCDRCESRNWVATPDATSAAVCVVCDYVEYDETIIEDAWRPQQ